MIDEYNLKRFLEPQSRVFEAAIAMLRRKSMCAPYMDVIFPRLDLGGVSDRRFVLSSLDEASAYLDFPVLGDRYRQCVEALSHSVTCAVGEVFGPADAMKLRASLTLFSEATSESLFRSCLAVWFDGRADEPTMVRLQTAR